MGERIVTSRTRKTLLAAALVAVALAIVAVGTWKVEKSREEHAGPLTGAEIKELVAGNTVQGPKFTEYYDPVGAVRGQEIEEEDDKYEGSWRVDGDKLCVDFPSHGYSNCVTIVRLQGSDYDFVSDRPNRRTVISGNPKHL